MNDELLGWDTEQDDGHNAGHQTHRGVQFEFADGHAVLARPVR